MVVTKAIWFRDARGNEHHVRVASDVPVRIGQHVALGYLTAERPASGKAVDDLASVYVLSTDQYWSTRDFGSVAKVLVEREMTPGGAVGILAMWVAALALCLVAIGIPLVIALFVMAKVHERRDKALAAEIATAMAASHLDVIRATWRTFQAEKKRLAEREPTKIRVIGAGL